MFYIGAVLVTKYVDKKTKGKKKNHGGKRLEGPVKEVNKDLDRLNILIEGKTMKGKYCDSTQKIYKVIEKGGGGGGNKRSTTENQSKNC